MPHRRPLVCADDLAHEDQHGVTRALLDMPGLTSTNLGASVDAAARAAPPGLPGLDAPSARQARPSRPFGAPAVGKPTSGAAAQSTATPCGGCDCAGCAHSVFGLRLWAGRPDPAFGGLCADATSPPGGCRASLGGGATPPKPLTAAGAACFAVAAPRVLAPPARRRPARAGAPPGAAPERLAPCGLAPHGSHCRKASVVPGVGGLSRCAVTAMPYAVTDMPLRHIRWGKRLTANGKRQTAYAQGQAACGSRTAASRCAHRIRHIGFDDPSQIRFKRCLIQNELGARDCGHRNSLGATL